jgi:hypothetical protein
MGEEIPGEKITQILEETRVVIPGTEIFLAFQLEAIFSDVFQRLSPLYKQIHVCSFILVIISIIMLISLAPYHRICDQGKNTGRTLWYANRTLLISMFVMATDISVNIWLICAIATSTTLAWYVSVSVWALAMLVWFILPYFRKEAT